MLAACCCGGISPAGLMKRIKIGKWNAKRAHKSQALSSKRWIESIIIYKDNVKELNSEFDSKHLNDYR